MELGIYGCIEVVVNGHQEAISGIEIYIFWNVSRLDPSSAIPSYLQSLQVHYLPPMMNSHQKDQAVARALARAQNGLQSGHRLCQQALVGIIHLD